MLVISPALQSILHIPDPTSSSTSSGKKKKVRPAIKSTIANLDTPSKTSSTRLRRFRCFSTNNKLAITCFYTFNLFRYMVLISVFSPSVVVCRANKKNS